MGPCLVTARRGRRPKAADDVRARCLRPGARRAQPHQVEHRLCRRRRPCGPRQLDDLAGVELPPVGRRDRAKTDTGGRGWLCRRGRRARHPDDVRLFRPSTCAPGGDAIRSRAEHGRGPVPGRSGIACLRDPFDTACSTSARSSGRACICVGAARGVVDRPRVRGPAGGRSRRPRRPAAARGAAVARLGLRGGCPRGGACLRAPGRLARGPRPAVLPGALRRTAPARRGGGRDRRATNLEGVASRVVSRIETALHPEYVTLLSRQPRAAAYRSVASAPTLPPSFSLRPDSKVVGLVRLLGRPVDTSAGDTGWLRNQLPHDETTFLRESRIGLIVPVALREEGEREALLVLGIKRSEEPCTRARTRTSSRRWRGAGAPCGARRDLAAELGGRGERRRADDAIGGVRRVRALRRLPGFAGQALRPGRRRAGTGAPPARAGGSLPLDAPPGARRHGVGVRGSGFSRSNAASRSRSYATTSSAVPRPRNASGARRVRPPPSRTRTW